VVGEVARSDADETGAESVLRSVVVYAAGAVCTRRARVGVPTGGGEATVRIGGLPPTLYEHSLRGRVVAPAGGPRVTDIRLDLGATLRRGDELPSVRLDLEDAEDRQATLRDRLERLASEIEEVAGLRAEPPQPRRGDPPRWAPVESLLALAGFVDSRLGVLHERLRAAEDQLAQAEHDVDVLEVRLHQSSSAQRTERAEPSVRAVVTLALDDPRGEARPADRGGLPAAGENRPRQPAAEPVDGGIGDGDLRDRDGDFGEAATDAKGSADVPPAALDESAATAAERGPVEIEVEYQVPGAAWLPTYQLRLDGSSGTGTLVLRASVAQRTGEDWSGVRLGLSTADLLRRADLPELRSLRIGRSQQEPPALGWREPPAGLADLFTGYDGAAAAQSPAAPSKFR